MRFLTKARAEHQDDLKFMLAIYADKLSEYPADVVMHVLKTQPSQSMWWPAWDELRDRLELYAKKRMKRYAALRDLAEMTAS